MKTIHQIPKVIWRRLPWIALYAVAITGLLFVGEFVYYRYAEGTRFINYTSFHFNSIEEHKDVPFEACKKTDFEYKINGNRKIYRIPDGKGEIDKVLVKTYPLDSIISTTPCVNAFITPQQYDFSAGNYQIYTTFNFSVKYGNRKSVTFKSNIFAVLPSHPVTVQEIQTKIDELQKQIDLLRLQLQATQSNMTPATPVATTPSTAVGQSVATSQSAPTPTPIDPPTDTRNPLQKLGDGVVNTLRSIVTGIGGLLK